MRASTVPTRKFVVFVSSVTTEFEKLRQELWELIHKAGHIPVVMEKAPSFPARQLREHIKKEVSDSDIFVFILGQELGRGMDETNSSFIADELNTAIDQQIPIIVLRDTTSGPGLPRNATAEQARIEAEFRKMEAKAHRMPQMIEFVREEGYGGLKEKFAIVLRNVAASLPQGGWVKGAFYDRASEQISLGQTVSQNPFFKRFVKRLRSFRTLSRRTVRSRVQKLAMSEFFWEAFLPRLCECHVKRLFFESGSTIAYLSHEFMQRMKRPWVGKWISETDLVIDTNNILTYLDFVLAEPNADPVQCHLRPPAPADTYYGATFGRELAALNEMWPPMQPRKLSSKAKAACKKLLRMFDFQSDSLILMTASGLDNSTDGFRGPHVGSYYNTLMKRVLLESAAPAILVMEESKMFKEFRRGRCFPVCDRNGAASWDNICRTRPLAILTCAAKDKSPPMREALEKMGFVERIEGAPRELDVARGDAARGDDTQCMLVANEAFAKCFSIEPTQARRNGT